MPWKNCLHYSLGTHKSGKHRHYVTCCTRISTALGDKAREEYGCYYPSDVSGETLRSLAHSTGVNVLIEEAVRETLAVVGSWFATKTEAAFGATSVRAISYEEALATAANDTPSRIIGCGWDPTGATDVHFYHVTSSGLDGRSVAGELDAKNAYVNDCEHKIYFGSGSAVEVILQKSGKDGTGPTTTYYLMCFLLVE